MDKRFALLVLKGVMRLVLTVLICVGLAAIGYFVITETFLHAGFHALR